MRKVYFKGFCIEEQENGGVWVWSKNYQNFSEKNVLSAMVVIGDHEGGLDENS